MKLKKTSLYWIWIPISIIFVIFNISLKFSLTLLFHIWVQFLQIDFSIATIVQIKMNKMHTLPTYYQCTVDIYSTALKQYNLISPNASHLHDFMDTLYHFTSISLTELYLTITIATLLTITRYIVSAKVYKVCLKYNLILNKLY